MENAKGKKLTDTIEYWSKKLIEILDATEFAPGFTDISNLKNKFYDLSFENIYNDFEEEVRHNIVHLKNIDYIDNYLVCQVLPDEFKNQMIEFIKYTHKRIFKNNYEIKFLLDVYEACTNNFNKLLQLCYSENNTNYSNRLRQLFTEEMQKINPEFESIVLDTNPIHKNSISPVEDYSIEQLKLEISELSTVKEKVKHVQTIMFDYEQWFLREITCDTNPDVEDINFNDTEFYQFCEIELRRQKTMQELEKNEEKTKTYEPYEWVGTHTELLELFTALYHSKKLERVDGKEFTRKEFLDYIQDIFNVDIKDAEGKLTRATDRKNNRTPFIDSLRTAFEAYADGKEEKQRKRR